MKGGEGGGEREREIIQNICYFYECKKYVTFTNVKIKSKNSKFYNKNPIKSGT